MFSTSIVSASGGWKCAARTFFRPGFYRRLLAEVDLRQIRLPMHNTKPDISFLLQFNSTIGEPV
jgi:hypothetical protein